MRLGTVGTNWITASFIEAAHLSGKFTLHSMYSRSLEKARAFADRFGAPNAYDNIEEMAKAPDIDVVYIASPNALHYAHAKLFLENGKHVICEKPIFSNTKEWEAAFASAEANGVYLFEAIRNIHAPNFKRLKNRIKDIGTVRGAVFHLMQYSSRYDAFKNGEEPNVFTRKFSGGALVDLGVYPTYLAVALFDEPKKVSYHPILLRGGVDGGGTLVLDYDGFVVTVLCSKIADAGLACEIHGEDGTIAFDKVAPISTLTLKERKTGKTEAFHVEQHEQDMVYEAEEFARIIESADQSRYEALKALSRTVLTITETARKQNGILFPADE
jgi:predicted dehydrogenase